jgi:hypothetical protein
VTSRRLADSGLDFDVDKTARLEELLASPLLWKTHKAVVKALANSANGVTGPALDLLVGNSSAHKRLNELRDLGVVEARGTRDRCAVWFLTGKLPVSPAATPVYEVPTAPQPDPTPNTTREPVEVVFQEEVLQRCLPVLRKLYLNMMRAKNSAAPDIKLLSVWVADMVPEPESQPLTPLPPPKAPPKDSPKAQPPWWTGQLGFED